MKALVTGGSGFLGKALVARLRARGFTLASLARHEDPDLAALGVEQHIGDIGDRAAVLAAARGADILSHTAAKAGVAGPLKDYWRANVDGTQNVLDAAREHGIRWLVHTSSPSVVFDGRDQEGIDESAPYPARFLAHYPRSKAEAERRVLQANGAELCTVALRPHLIWGPGDRHLVPRVVAMGRAGKLRFVGSGDKLVDAVYIDNAAAAHVAALDALRRDPAVAGKAYFITNHEPWPMGRILNEILAAAGLPPNERRVPAGAAWFAGACLETLASLAGGRREPSMTRFVARQLATAHWYDNGAARRDLGYEPEVSMSDGFRRLRAAFAAENGA